MNRRRAFTIILAACALLATPATAQYEEDEQTRDYEERDRRYLERYQKPQETEPEQPATVDQAEQAFLEQAEAMIRAGKTIGQVAQALGL